MDKKLISVIVSTYNSEKFFRKKLEDLFKQTVIKDSEIIIVNSGSAENEEAVVREYLADHDNIKYVKTDERETIYKAWNRGIKISEGEFITNSNTDDRLRYDALEILSSYLQKNPDVALVYADQYLSQIPNQPFNELKSEKVLKFPEFNRFLQLSRSLVGSQPMWRSSLHFNDNYWFNENYEIVGDHDFQLRISEKHKMSHIPEVLGTFYKDYKGKSNRELMNMNETYAEAYELLYGAITNFLENSSLAELERCHRKIGIWTKLPLKAYLINKKIREIFFPDQFNYTLEFIYFFSGLLMIKKGQTLKAEKLFQKYLLRKKSIWIEKEYSKLITPGRDE